MDSNQDHAIAKAKFLGYFMTARQPVNINVELLAQNLELSAAQITTILKELEAESRLTLTITRAIAQRLSPLPEVAQDTAWEATEAKAAKRGRSDAQA